MIAAGGWGVFIPHALTSAIEHAETPQDTARFGQLARLDALPAFIDTLISSTSA